MSAIFVVAGALPLLALAVPSLAPLASAWATQGLPSVPPGPIAIGALTGGLLLGIATHLGLRARSAGKMARVQPREPAALDKRTARRVQKQANAIAKKGGPREAAELCFHAGLLDRAAELFIAAEDYVRAAEIRHDQNRFSEAADLHIKAGDHETAATILAAQGEYKQAAQCFTEVGRMSVAAEMWEKAGDHRRAGDAYRKAGFDRESAQAYIRCQAWLPAAEALEDVLLEETTRAGGGQNPGRHRELQKLVLQCGKLYEQAGALDRAQRILEKGGSYAAAAEVALTRKEYARASELLLEAGQALRAAEILREFGEDQAAARILGEHYQHEGQGQLAAEHLEKAGDHLAAGDAYRSVDDFENAARAYEQAGDGLQAAEMYRAAGNPARAAICYAKARQWLDAAECFADASEFAKQAQCLQRAGHCFEAGRILHDRGHADEAIKVLQQVAPDSPNAGDASALLGQIFQSRGQHNLAITKLRHAIGGQDLFQGNVQLYYTLATAQEANGDLAEAIDVYERILAFDYHYEDVEPRLAAARAKAAAMPETATGEEGAAASGSSRATTGRYRILEELGRGGMGIVYKATDTVLDREVAFKVLPDALKENPQALRNFLREAKAAAQLNHPNIVTVYDAGEQGGRYYIAMEFVDGSTLKQIVRKRGAIAPGGVLHVLVQMCEALAYAHEKKVIHRDIKTANTMWTRERKAKIMDFGLAKVVEEVRNHTTLVSGTPYYMSPEQTLGRNVDHRTDLYSLGVTLFELCTGNLPFTEGNIPYHHVHTPAPDPREQNPQVPAPLAEIIGRCLRKDPAERYGGAREILQQVRASMGSGAETGKS